MNAQQATKIDLHISEIGYDAYQASRALLEEDHVVSLEISPTPHNTVRVIFRMTEKARKLPIDFRVAFMSQMANVLYFVGYMSIWGGADVREFQLEEYFLAAEGWEFSSTEAAFTAVTGIQRYLESKVRESCYTVLV